MPLFSHADYSWNWVHGVKRFTESTGANIACQIGVGKAWYRGYAKQLVDVAMSERGDSATCIVQLKACKECAWESPKNNWVEGWPIVAVRDGTPCGVGKKYDTSTGECFSFSGGSAGKPPSQCDGPKDNAGNPIYFATGNKYQHEIYYKGRGWAPLEFSLFYNSHDKAWRHNYSTRLRLSDDEVVLVFADGRSILFSASTLQPISVGEFGSLEKNNDVWIYAAADGREYSFNKAGRLIKVASMDGGLISLSYSGFLVFNASSRVHGSNHWQHKITVTSQTDTLIITEVDGLMPVSVVTDELALGFWWGAYKKLTKASFSSSDTSYLVDKTYHYEDPRSSVLLTGITDERGVRYATWAYDEQGRAISSEHADGADKVTVAYNTDGSSTVTNALGKQTTYRFQTIQGVRRITAIEGEPSANCPNSNSTFAYDERGLLTRKTDNKGNVTTYTYNERGLEVSRTEAAGTPQARTITTEWHPEFFLPAKVTEPRQVTVYTYDAQGRELDRLVREL